MITFDMLREPSQNQKFISFTVSKTILGQISLLLNG